MLKDGEGIIGVPAEVQMGGTQEIAGRRSWNLFEPKF